MKIYHVISNKVWGGGEQYVLDLCRHLIDDGHDVELFCRPCPPVLSRLTTLDVPVHSLYLRGAGDVMSALQMAKVIGKEACVVHVHNFKDAFTVWYACQMAGNRRAKLIVTRHLVRRGKTSWLYRQLYRHIHHIVFVSDLARREFLSSHPLISEEKLSVIHNSIALQPLKQVEQLREILSIPSQAVLAMYHGRLAAEKGLETLIDALGKAHVEAVHLVLIGNGEEAYVNRLKEKIAENGLKDQVHFMGFKADVLSYIPQSDFGILPSIVREACPLSCMEYMSQGKCVIATNNGGQSEYVEKGVNGILIPPADADALADALTQLTQDKELREALGKKAQEYFFSTLSYEQFYSKILAIYHQ